MLRFTFPESTKALLEYLHTLPTEDSQYLLAAYTQSLSLLKDDEESLFIFLDFIDLFSLNSEKEEIEHFFNLFKVKLRKFKLFWLGYIHFEVKRGRSFECVFHKVLDYLKVKMFEGKNELMKSLLEKKDEIMHNIMGNDHFKIGEYASDSNKRTDQGNSNELIEQHSACGHLHYLDPSTIKKENNKNLTLDNNNLHNKMEKEVKESLIKNNLLEKDDDLLIRMNDKLLTHIDSGISESKHEPSYSFLDGRSNLSSSITDHKLKYKVLESIQENPNILAENVLEIANSHFIINDHNLNDKKEVDKYFVNDTKFNNNSGRYDYYSEEFKKFKQDHEASETYFDKNLRLEGNQDSIINEIQERFHGKDKEVGFKEDSIPVTLSSLTKNVNSHSSNFIPPVTPTSYNNHQSFISQIKKNEDSFGSMKKASSVDQAVYELELSGGFKQSIFGFKLDKDFRPESVQNVIQPTKKLRFSPKTHKVYTNAKPTGDSTTSSATNVLENGVAFTCELNKTKDLKNTVIKFKKKDLVCVKKIGKGGYSNVYCVVGDDLYALKQIQVDDKDAYNHCSDEINLLKKLSCCDFVVKMIDYEFRNDHVNILLEYGETDLQRIMQSGNMSLFLIKYFWESILKILVVIHKNRIVHRDIKPANFVLVRGRLKIIDFGISKSIRGDTTSILNFEKAGTLNYISPEQCTGGRVGRSSDVWSAGCILYHMIYRKTVHNGNTAMEVLRLMADEFEISYGNVDKKLVETLQACLKFNPKMRAKPEELLQMDFMKYG